jgi:Flp pilus assembly pilin Flp
MSKLLSLIGYRGSGPEGSDEFGQAMVEYSLIILLVVIVCIVVVTQLGDVLRNGLYGAVESLPL